MEIDSMPTVSAHRLPPKATAIPTRIRSNVDRRRQMPNSVAPGSGPRSVLQCACGGGCPRCSGATDAAERDAEQRAIQLTSAGRVPAGVQAGGFLDAATLAYFEPRLRTDLSGVRLHTGASAAREADALGAQAYTVGDQIGFAAGAWKPGSRAGQALLAHELVHVAQQRGTFDGAVHLKSDEPTAEEVAEDPSLLLCFIMCELGVPPSLWRKITGMMMKAVWAEYRESYGDLQGQVMFRRFQLVFRAYSLVAAVDTVLDFVVNGEFLFKKVSSATGIALRKRMTEMLIKKGATKASLAAAQQVARKILVAIEVAIAAGCLTYCTASTMITIIKESTTVLAEGLTDAISALEKAGEIAGGLATSIADTLVVRPLLTAVASLDPLNWDRSSLPNTLAQADMLALGMYWSSQLKDKEGDQLLAELSKPVSKHPTAADLVRSVVRAINEQRKAKGHDPLPATEDEFADAKPFQVVSMLIDNGHLDFEVDPSDIVDEMYADEAEDEEEGVD